MEILTLARERVRAAEEERAAAADDAREAARIAREQGMTLAAIGEALGVSKQRVDQMLRGH